MATTKLNADDSCGIIQLKLGGVIYEKPWSQNPIYQHNDVDRIVGFPMFKGSTGQNTERQAYMVLYEGRRGFIMEWDAGSFFERPKRPNETKDS